MELNVKDKKTQKAEIITPLQRDVLKALFADDWFRRHFYLTGGTALSAFYFRHRYSDDLDFFCHEIDLSPVPKLVSAVTKRFGIAIRQTQTSPGFMRFVAGEELKIDVVCEPAFRVGSPELVEDYMVDSLKNIAVNKVCAILSRTDAKDFVDLFWILRETPFDIFELLDLGRNKDGGLDPFIWASLIAEVQGFSLLPRMIEPLALEDLKDFYLKLRDRILDEIDPRGKG